MASCGRGLAATEAESSVIGALCCSLSETTTPGFSNIRPQHAWRSYAWVDDRPQAGRIEIDSRIAEPDTAGRSLASREDNGIPCSSPSGRPSSAANASQPSCDTRLVVLLVDDDPAVRQICSRSLQLAEIDVIEAEDGQCGLQQARDNCPDLVLLDVRMPGLDAFEVAAALRRDESTSAIPLVFLSGEAEEANAPRARKLGALAYLTKPFSPLALAALVTRALARQT
jgi:CheY-like chemotaxis protein